MHLTLLQNGKKLIHRGLLLLVCLSIATSLAQAQGVTGVTQRITSGKITSSEDNSPMPGVNVVVKGTTNGTVTDADGNFQISASSANDVIIFSFVG